MYTIPTIHAPTLSHLGPMVTLRSFFILALRVKMFKFLGLTAILVISWTTHDHKRILDVYLSI